MLKYFRGELEKLISTISDVFLVTCSKNYSQDFLNFDGFVKYLKCYIVYHISGKHFISFEYIIYRALGNMFTTFDDKLFFNYKGD